MKLAQKLLPRLDAMQTPSRFDSNGARIISAMPQDNVVRLLTEINETVLARSLQFATGTGAKLSMDVAGRRVLRISDITDSNGNSAPDAIVGKELSQEDTENGFLSVIRDLAEGAESITVSAAALEKAGDGGAGGLSVSHIAELMSVDLHGQTAAPVSTPPISAPAPGPTSVASQFLAHLTGARAWFIAKGADTGASFGDPAIVDVLRQSAENGAKGIMAQLDQLGPGAGEPICAVIGNLSQEGTSIICLRTEDQLALAVIPANLLGSVVSAWRGI